MTVAVLLLILAFISFVVAAMAVPVPRVNLIALGLAFWVLAVILGTGALHG